MTGLPRKFVKKYGMTKRAWKEFRKTAAGKKTIVGKRRVTKSKSRTINRSVKTKRRTRTMAKRKYYGKKKASRKKSGTSALVKLGIGAVAYGAGRDFASDKLSPLTARVPLGQFADNAVMTVLALALAKGKVPYVSKALPLLRDVGKAGFAIEAALLGKELMDSIQGQNSGATAGNQIF